MERQWFYLDRTGAEFGPFQTGKMRAWFAHGYFPICNVLLVRMTGWNMFFTVRDLFPDSAPFKDLTHVRLCAAHAGVWRLMPSTGKAITLDVEALDRTDSLQAWHDSPAYMLGNTCTRDRGRCLFTSFSDDIGVSAACRGVWEHVANPMLLGGYVRLTRQCDSPSLGTHAALNL